MAPTNFFWFISRIILKMKFFKRLYFKPWKIVLVLIHFRLLILKCFGHSNKTEMTFCLQGCVKDIGTETPEVIWQIKVEMNVINMTGLDKNYSIQQSQPKNSLMQLFSVRKSAIQLIYLVMIYGLCILHSPKSNANKSYCTGLFMIHIVEHSLS